MKPTEEDRRGRVWSNSDDERELDEILANVNQKVWTNEKKNLEEVLSSSELCVETSRSSPLTETFYDARDCQILPHQDSLCLSPEPTKQDDLTAISLEAKSTLSTLDLDSVESDFQENSVINYKPGSNHSIEDQMKFILKTMEKTEDRPRYVKFVTKDVRADGLRIIFENLMMPRKAEKRSFFRMEMSNCVSSLEELMEMIDDLKVENDVTIEWDSLYALLHSPQRKDQKLMANVVEFVKNERSILDNFKYLSYNTKVVIGMKDSPWCSAVIYFHHRRNPEVSFLDSVSVIIDDVVESGTTVTLNDEVELKTIDESFGNFKYTGMPTVKARYDFECEQGSNRLPMTKNEVLTVIDPRNDDSIFLEARNSYGEVGLVPRQAVDLRSLRDTRIVKSSDGKLLCQPQKVHVKVRELEDAMCNGETLMINDNEVLTVCGSVLRESRTIFCINEQGHEGFVLKSKVYPIFFKSSEPNSFRNPRMCSIEPEYHAAFPLLTHLIRDKVFGSMLKKYQSEPVLDVNKNTILPSVEKRRRVVSDYE